MKRALSFVLALVLMFGMLPLNTFATETAETTEATETTEVTEAIEVTYESEPTEYVDPTSPEAEVNIVVVESEDNTVCIPDGWNPVPISTTENSDHIAYKIENGVLSFHDFGDPSSVSYGRFTGYTNGKGSETNWNIPPWYQQRNGITKVVFDDTISYIGSYIMSNMDDVTEIYIHHPNASVARDFALFSTFNREEPLSIFAASTIKTVESWIRGKNARTLSSAISDTVFYFTDLSYLAPQFVAIEEALEDETDIDAQMFCQVLELVDQVPKHTYTLSDYRCAIPGTDQIVDILRNMSSGTCGDNLTYQFAVTAEGNLNLTIDGTGAMAAYATAEDAPWYLVADSIHDVTIGTDVTWVPDGVLPADATYHVALNSYAYTFTKSNNLNVQIDTLRILCIGNSHTADYSQFLTNIITDMENAGFNTEVVIDKTIISSIGLFSGRNSNVNATYRSHLEAIQNGNGAYSNLVNNRYDLVIVQDYMESVVDTPAAFTDGLSSFIRTIKTIAVENGNGDPEVAWFADWVDVRTTGAENALYDGNGNKIALDKLSREQVYQKSLTNIAEVENAIARNASNMPDFVIHASTIKQNAMSSYLGTTKMWDSSKYCLLERDTTHLTYELGRYLLGAGVMSEIITHYGDILALGRNGTNVGNALTVQNGPVASGSGCQYDGSINAELLTVIREAISSPNVFHQSVYTTDPVESIMAKIADMDWNFDGVTNQETALEAIKVQINAAYGQKLNSFTVTMSEYTSAVQFKVLVRLYYGYSTAEAIVEVVNTPPLVITKQPADVKANLGEKFKITVEAEGEDLTYQWYYSNNGGKSFAVSSFKTKSYAMTMANYCHNRQVYCVITDAKGNSVQTETVTITAPLTITKQPVNVQAEIGQKFSISVEVLGDGLTYQWYYKNSGSKNFAVSSFKGKSYSMTMANYCHNRQVYCVITDKYGNSVTTETVTISRPPEELKILTQPTDVYAAKGQKFSVSFQVQGDGLTYQWYYKDSYMKDFKISSYKSAAYSMTMAAYHNNRQVYCVITDQYGNQVTTEVATIHLTK